MRLAAAVICAMAVSGCTASPTEPTPVTSTPMTPRPTEPPPVTRTLDVNQHRGKPCALLDGDEQVSLEAPPLSHEGQLDCEFEKWQPVHTQIVIQLSPENDVLRSAYLNSNQTIWQQFQPVSIAGQPAVIRSLGKTGQNLTCEVVVGAGPSQGVTVSAAGMDGSVDWCGKARAAAEFVLSHLG